MTVRLPTQAVSNAPTQERMARLSCVADYTPRRYACIHRDTEFIGPDVKQARRLGH